MQFAFGYTPEEFSRTLASISAGDIDVAPLITGEVGIAGVPDASGFGLGLCIPAEIKA